MPVKIANQGDSIILLRAGHSVASTSAETSVEEPKLTLTNGTPRLWIMKLKKRRLVFADMARHRRVSQCLGSMQGKEWFIGVAPPNDPADGVGQMLTNGHEYTDLGQPTLVT
jgi:hypothetical protein